MCVFTTVWFIHVGRSNLSMGGGGGGGGGHSNISLPEQLLGPSFSISLYQSEFSPNVIGLLIKCDLFKYISQY